MIASIRWYVETFRLQAKAAQRMTYDHLLKLLRDNPAKSFSFEEAQKALDMPEGEEYLLMLQSAVLKIKEQERLQFNNCKSKFQYKERS